MGGYKYLVLFSLTCNIATTGRIWFHIIWLFLSNHSETWQHIEGYLMMTDTEPHAIISSWK